MFHSIMPPEIRQHDQILYIIACKKQALRFITWRKQKYYDNNNRIVLDPEFQSIKKPVGNQTG